MKAKEEGAQKRDRAGNNNGVFCSADPVAELGRDVGFVIVSDVVGKVSHFDYGHGHGEERKAEDHAQDDLETNVHLQVPDHANGPQSCDEVTDNFNGYRQSARVQARVRAYTSFPQGDVCLIVIRYTVAW